MGPSGAPCGSCCPREGPGGRGDEKGWEGAAPQAAGAAADARPERLTSVGTTQFLSLWKLGAAIKPGATVRSEHQCRGLSAD